MVDGKARLLLTEMKQSSAEEPLMGRRASFEWDLIISNAALLPEICAASTSLFLDKEKGPGLLKRKSTRMMVVFSP